MEGEDKTRQRSAIVLRWLVFIVFTLVRAKFKKSYFDPAIKIQGKGNIGHQRDSW